MCCHVCLYGSVRAWFYIFSGLCKQTLTWWICRGAELASSTRGRAGEEAGIQRILGILSGSWIGPDPSFGQSCFGVSQPDHPRHGQLYSLLHWLPSVQLVETGQLTNGWPSAGPTNLRQTDHATFISLREEAGTFWFSQVEAIDSSLCTDNLLLQGLFTVITKPFGRCFL